MGGLKRNSLKDCPSYIPCQKWSFVQWIAFSPTGAPEPTAASLRPSCRARKYQARHEKNSATKTGKNLRIAFPGSAGENRTQAQRSQVGGRVGETYHRQRTCV